MYQSWPGAGYGVTQTYSSLTGLEPTTTYLGSISALALCFRSYGKEQKLSSYGVVYGVVVKGPSSAGKES